jgi:hypothetical protein
MEKISDASEIDLKTGFCSTMEMYDEIRILKEFREKQPN